MNYLNIKFILFSKFPSKIICAVPVASVVAAIKIRVNMEDAILATEGATIIMEEAIITATMWASTIMVNLIIIVGELDVAKNE
jgi:hypothetical protein